MCGAVHAMKNPAPASGREVGQQQWANGDSLMGSVYDTPYSKRPPTGDVIPTHTIPLFEQMFPYYAATTARIVAPLFARQTDQFPGGLRPFV